MSSSEKSRKKRAQRDYNLGFKLSIVCEVKKGNYTYKQIQKAYGIQGKSIVLASSKKYFCYSSSPKQRYNRTVIK